MRAWAGKRVGRLRRAVTKREVNGRMGMMAGGRIGCYNGSRCGTGKRGAVGRDGIEVYVVLKTTIEPERPKVGK